MRGRSLEIVWLANRPSIWKRVKLKKQNVYLLGVVLRSLPVLLKLNILPILGLSPAFFPRELPYVQASSDAITATITVLPFVRLSVQLNDKGQVHLRTGHDDAEGDRGIALLCL